MGEGYEAGDTKLSLIVGDSRIDSRHERVAVNHRDFYDSETALPGLPRPRLLSARRRGRSTAIIVDPQHDIQQYLADAEKFGLQIRHIFLTHFHADFVAGHLELHERCGAIIRLGSRAQAESACVAMKDGDTLFIGDVGRPDLRASLGVNIPLNHLQERIAEIPRDRRIAVHCAGGYRASSGASILRQYGVTNLIAMAGGLAAWDAAKLPVVSEA